MDIEAAADRPRPPKKKRQATYLPDGAKLNVKLPTFRSNKENPEINLPMLKLAFRDLIEHLRADRVLEYKLHTIAVGEYGRYAVDLFYQLKGHSFDAHIDILDQFKILSVIMLDLKKKEVTSVYPRAEWNGNIIDLREYFASEIDEIMSILPLDEEQNIQEGSAG